MYNASIESAALFEHRFWLQILGDHSRFILNSLSPDERDETARAQHFILVFDSLLDRVRQDISGREIAAITGQAYNHGCEIRAFKLHLLKRHLTGKIKIMLSPTFFNHMLNELEEYMGIMSHLMSGSLPAHHPLHHHLLWLPDGVGHAASVAANLDEVEKTGIEKAKGFQKDFEDLHDKATEMSGYMRTGLESFPALSCLNCQVERAMVPFKEFLEELKQQRLDNRVLGTLLPLMADHMAREECYYLTRLSLVSDVKRPDCDPARPRVE